jgi:hypothetical protein
LSKFKIPSVIRLEDYDEKDRAVVEKIAASVNPFMEDVYRQLNGALNTDNMTRQITVIDVKMNASGQVVNRPQIKLNLKARLVGLNVIAAQNMTNATTYPTGTPFVSYSIVDGLVTIANITGLQASSKYRLTVEIIGN